MPPGLRSAFRGGRILVSEINEVSIEQKSIGCEICSVVR